MTRPPGPLHATTTSSELHPAWSYAYLGVGALALVLRELTAEPARGWMLVAVVAATAISAGVAAWRERSWTSPSALLMAGTLVLLPAYALWYPLALQSELGSTTGAVTDTLFIGGYLCFVAAMARLIRLRASDDQRVQVLDSLIISLGVGVLAWTLVIAPAARSAGNLADQIPALSYPAIDLVLLGAVVRLLVQGRLGSVGDRLLTGWIGLQLGADLVYTVTSLRGTFDLADASPTLYAGSFVLLGAAVLHPSLRSEHRREGGRPLSAWRRLVLVGAAALVAPAALVGLGLTDNAGDVPIVALVAAATFVLVLARIGILMVDVEEHRRIQHRLEDSIREERRQVAENRDLLVSLRERQALSERLFRIQRKISTRAPLQDVLDAITAGAAELLRDEVVGLRLVDLDDPTMMTLVSSVGLPDDAAPELRRLRVGDGVGGRAVSENRLCIEESYVEWRGALPAFRSWGLRAAMGAPVHLAGRPIGSLVVASYREGRSFSVAEQDMLTTFAEHASIALNDARTVDAMHEALDRALHQAMHDGLTGLPNRACFYDRLEQALRAGRRDGSLTAVLLFDLDRFKEINDTLGHRYGDLVLGDIGPRIRAVLREADTLARLGGDEFCVLLPHVSGAQEACDVAGRIIAALEDPFEIDGMLLAVEASCGVVVAPDHGDTAELLLQRADVAMYLSKASHVEPVVYRDELDVNTPERLALLGELRVGIATDQLVLHVQPQVALATGEVEGVEALVRWMHPRLGFLGPDRFIPIAEDTGLIKPLTAWVLDAGLRQLRAWLDEGLDLPDDFAMAINVSTRSLLDDSFVDDVVAALDRARVPADRLVLEVTETAIMADPTRADRLLCQLAELGVRFAIDDFGTGYSSLAALKVLPVHQLKIDKSFVTQMHTQPNDATIVRSVIDLGRTLGLRTVAEGVETEAAWEQLSDLGCDAAQGYLLARPMPPSELRRWLEERTSRQPVVSVG